MSATIPIHILRSTDWQRRLDNAKKCAENGREGDVFFLQVSKNPLVSLFITTGSLVGGGTNLRSVDLRFVGQHSLYPKCINSNTQSDVIGYQYFKRSCEKNNNGLFNSYDLDVYKERFEQTCLNLDKSIVDFHGVRCYRDNDPHNNATNNYFVMHLCDIFNIMIHANFGTQPELKLKTQLLKNLPEHGVINELESRYLTEANKSFLIHHIDFFYLCYGYYGNHSFVPIRTSMEKNHLIFQTSSFFMNDDHFVEHQKGKLKEFNQNESRTVSRLIYRSI